MNDSIKIGPEFFAKIKMDYADWRWALVREFLQNCFDAPGCRDVQLTVDNGSGNTVLTVTNDGKPMNRDTLVNKLLTLGGSGKNFDGENTGGFGVAKSLLYYCHKDYDILTGDLRVQGRGARYSISEATASQEGSGLDGTRSTITVDGDEVAGLVDAAKKFASMAQWKGELTVNGEALPTDMHKGARRKDIGWAMVYTNNTFSNTCVVRLNGQPMFSCYTRFKGTVLLELTGKACKTLTSNRDGLVRPYSSQLNDLLTALAVDKKSALREQRAEYRRYAGEVQRNKAKQPKASDDGLKAAGIDLRQIAASVQTGVMGGGASTEPTPETANNGGIQLVVESREDAPSTISVGPQFILKNATGMKTPTYYTPGDGFSRYSRDLVRSWTGLLLKLHQITNRGGEFSVGFVIDEESEAESERSAAYGQVYYVNPATVKADGGKRRLERRFAGAWQDRHQLISLALHEFVHGAYGLNQHDEDYAGKLTDVTAVAFRHAEELADLCRPVVDGRGSAPPVRTLNFRDRRIDCMGHALTSVIKWMGREGWSFACVRDSLAELGINANENTIRGAIQDGKQPTQRGTKIADLTDDQVETLNKLARKYG